MELLRGRAGVAALLAAALPLAGSSCAAARPEPGPPVQDGPAPRLLWERRVTNAPASGLALSGDTLWVAGVDRKISSFDAATGKRHWRRSLPVSVCGTPVAAGELLLVPLGEPEPALLAVTRAEGHARWLHPLRGPAASLARGGRLAWLATEGGSLHALELSGGTEVWRRDRDVPLAGMAREEDALYVLGRRDSLWCWGEDGNLRWVVPVQGTHASPPVLVGGALLRVTYEGEVVKHDALTGRELARARVAFPQRAPLRPGPEASLASVATGGELEILALDGLAVLATVDLHETAGAGAWAWGPWWVVPTLKGTARAVTRARGTTAWGLVFDAPVTEAPVFDEARAAFIDDKGRLTVYVRGAAS